MGASIQWSALEVLVDLLGVEDVEMFIAELVTLQNFQAKDPDGSP